jgi:hypothetical protein
MKDDRTERLVLIAALAIVCGLAGWVSVTHVYYWTMDNSPERAGLSVGVTNAAISEIGQLICLLVLRHHRRAGRSIRGPLLGMAVCAGFSLTAQLAIAVPTPFGWLASAAPPIAFLGLTKLGLSIRPTDQPSTRPSTDAQPSFRSTTAPAPRGIAEPQDDGSKAPAPNPRRKRNSPQLLTSAVKVKAAASKLPPGASAEAVALKAGVSVSTARRYMTDERGPRSQNVESTRGTAESDAEGRLPNGVGRIPTSDLVAH